MGYGDWYNTIQLRGECLALAKDKTIKQEIRIYCYFQAYPNDQFTPFEIQERVFQNGTPITSVRRGITNLTNSGYLVKTDTLVMERQGKPNYKWQVAAREEKQIELPFKELEDENTRSKGRIHRDQIPI